jgi:hypothetical protein
MRNPARRQAAGKFVTFLLVLAFLGGCSPYSGNPDLRLARDFIDAYYVLADHRRALAVSDGSAKQEIEREIKLLEDVPEDANLNAYRSRDVLFALKRERVEPAETVYFYELTILVPGLEKRKQLINITIDRKLMKVSSFGDIK